MSVVERIEVLEDGAWAVYGFDAIAGVVNVITRKALSGGHTKSGRDNRLQAQVKCREATAMTQLRGHGVINTMTADADDLRLQGNYA